MSELLWANREERAQDEDQRALLAEFTQNSLMNGPDTVWGKKARATLLKAGGQDAVDGVEVYRALFALDR